MIFFYLLMFWKLRLSRFLIDISFAILDQINLKILQNTTWWSWQDSMTPTRWVLNCVSIHPVTAIGQTLSWNVQVSFTFDVSFYIKPPARRVKSIDGVELRLLRYRNRFIYWYCSTAASCSKLQGWLCVVVHQLYWRFFTRYQFIKFHRKRCRLLGDLCQIKLVLILGVVYELKLLSTDFLTHHHFFYWIESLCHNFESYF